MKSVKYIVRLALLLILAFVLYVIGSLIFATVTDFQPEERISLETNNKISPHVISDSTFSIITWNLGYGGLGAKSDFFFGDGGILTSQGKMVRSPKDYVQEYTNLQDEFIKNNPAEFYLFQEVDVDSKRSYFSNQQQRIQTILPDHESTFAVNYDVKRVAIPVLEPHNAMGKVYGGLGTFSRYSNMEATRLQLPGEYEWSTRIFQLDRCIALHRYSLQNRRELVVMNIHNSAYDKGGFIKKEQLKYLKELVLSEYQKGNYVVAGGDWNQCPPNFKFDALATSNPRGHTQINIEEDFLPVDWQWAFDPTVPTNRKVEDVYNSESSFKTIIDFYLLSPNIELVEVKGIDLDFAGSDHQPVFMEFRLR